MKEQIRSFLVKNSKRITVLGLMAAFVAVMGTFCAFNLYKNVEVTIDPNLSGVSAEVKTLQAQNMNQTVGQMLEANGITAEGWTADQPLDASLRSVDTVTLRENAVGTVTVDGTTVSYNSAPATVGDLLTELGITLTDHDYVTPSADTALTRDVTNIVIDRVDIVQETREEEIAFPIQAEESKALAPKETQIVTAGENGMKTVTESVRYHNGERVDAQVLTETVTKEPVTQVQIMNSTGVMTAGHKAYTVSDSDFSLICAIVQHEGGASYESAMAVMSCVLNRADAGNWGGGNDPAGILTASGQFESYFAGYYTQFLGNADASVQQAVRDCLAGTRSHSYERFRGYETTNSENLGGNYYF